MCPAQTDFEVNIEQVVFGGRGLARIDEKVVFVPDVLPGEKVKIRLKKHHTDYIDAELLSILEPSKKRKTPPEGFVMPVQSLTRGVVPYSPGYCYYYTDYATELKLKQTQFQELWGRYPDAKKKWIQKPIASPDNLHYRNKIKLTFNDDHGDKILGYVMSDNETVLDLPNGCPLAHEEINTELRTLRAKPGFFHTLQSKMTLTLRWTPNDGVKIWRNNPPDNASWLKEETCLGTFSTPQGSFYQVNIPVADQLIQRVRQLLSEIKPDALYDLYCGSGIFALAAATMEQPPEIVAGIDIDSRTIAAARYNAKVRNLENLKFYQGNADQIFDNFGGTLRGSNSCIIVDPPRTGLHPKLGHQIANSGVQNLIYVSCSPDTLLRDIIRLRRAGYIVQQTQLADMFPRTAHFETVTWLYKAL